MLPTRTLFGRCSQATLAVVVAEDGQLPGLDEGFFADLLFPARDIVEDQLGDVGVVADDDEHRRRDTAGAGFGIFLPQAVILFVVAVEAEQSPLEFDGQLRLALDLVCFPSLLGQMLADAEPQVAVVGCSPVIESSATGTRGTLTMPASMESIKEKSETTHGKSVPSR